MSLPERLMLPPLSCPQTWSPVGYPRRGFPPGHPLTRLLRKECRRIAGEALWERIETQEAQVEAGEVHPDDDRLVLGGSLAAQALRSGLDALLRRSPSTASLLTPRPYSTFGRWSTSGTACRLDRPPPARGRQGRRLDVDDSDFERSLLGDTYRQDLLRKHYLRRQIHGERSADGRIGGTGWQGCAAKEVISRRIDFAPLGVALDLRSGEAFVHREALRAALDLRIRVPADYLRLVDHHLLPLEVTWAPPLVIQTALPPMRSLLRAMAPLRRQRGLDDDVAERICRHFSPRRIRHTMSFHRYIEIYFRRLAFTGTCPERIISTWWLQYQRQPRLWCTEGELTMQRYIEALVSHPLVQRLAPGMPSGALAWSFHYMMLRPFNEEAGGDFAVGPCWGATIASAIVAEVPARFDATSATNVAADIVSPLIPLQWQSISRIRIFEEAGYACCPDPATEWPSPSLFV